MALRYSKGFHKEKRKGRHMLGAISCGELPQTEASYARGYLLAVMLGHHSDNGMGLPRQVMAFCREHSQTGTNLARSYLLAIRRLDGVPREIADLCGEHSQTEASSARNYFLAIALRPSLRLTLLGAFLGQRLL